jgi:prophage regulatory protein
MESNQLHQQVARALLKMPTVLERCALSRSELYRRVNSGRFPKPVPQGARGVAWLESDIEAWISERIAERDRATEAA